MIEKNKKIELLESTATLFFPEDSQLKLKDPSTVEVSFSKEKYPVLGINLQCFDNPKLNNDSNIKKFLVDDEDIKFGFKKKEDTFYLDYEIKVEKEKLLIHKILFFLKPRTFRLIRFALTWPDSHNAKKIIEPILEKLPKIINNIKFNANRTKYDELASLKYNLSNARLVERNLWETIKLRVPLKWRIDLSKENNFANVYMDLKDSYSFLIERFFINLNKNNKNNDNNSDKLVESLIQEITKEVSIHNAKLKKSEENNYLFYFIASEKDVNDGSKTNNSKIWYRIKVLKDKIVIVSFVFELTSHIELENDLYLEKLNQIISSSEILV